jgi:hypothetical protein
MTPIEPINWDAMLWAVVIAGARARRKKGIETAEDSVILEAYDQLKCKRDRVRPGCRHNVEGGCDLCNSCDTRGVV